MEFDFNPRSPHGERLGIATRQMLPSRKYFNPRSPHGERQLGRTCFSIQRSAFQSTLPARGATLGARRHGRRPHNFNPRSPHGERPALLRWRRWRRGFQPTLPARGATGAFCLAFLLFGISTHAPRTGSDVRRAINHHASAQFQPTLPARGATYAVPSTITPARNFNPRSPHGERRSTSTDTAAKSQFQSTLPARGATGKERRGRCTAGHFNPRSPHGERLNRNNTERLKQISIHAPRTGSDPQRSAGIRIPANFNPLQSTLPARGATRFAFLIFPS